MTHLNNGPIFSMEQVSVEYRRGKKTTHAINNISLQAYRGETLAVIGQSGSGKSTLAKALLGLEKITTGNIFVCQKDIHALNHAELRAVRKEMQMVFQDPSSSLNPKRSCGAHLKEALDLFGLPSQEHDLNTILSMVGLKAEIKNRYPFELSGGQKQRVAIARALCIQPKLLVLDEPLSALDMSVRSQIIILLQKLQKELELTTLFITHDLAQLPYIAQRILVLYQGSIVEETTPEKLFLAPKHPYTKELVASCLDIQK